MNLDRMSRRSLPGTGALLTIEKAIGPTSAAQPVDTKEATVLQESLIVPWKLQVSDEALADLRERLRFTRFPDQLASERLHCHSHRLRVFSERHRAQSTTLVARAMRECPALEFDEARRAFRGNGRSTGIG
jgi:hypothetical protein